MHFKRVPMSCVSNSLSAQVNLYVLIITTGNANAANDALTIVQWWKHNRLYMYLWDILGNLVSGEMVSVDHDDDDDDDDDDELSL